MPKYTKDMWSQWKDYRVGEVNDELTELLEIFEKKGITELTMHGPGYSNPEAKKFVEQDVKQMGKHINKASQQSIKIMIDGVKGGKYDAMDLIRGIKQGKSVDTSVGVRDMLNVLWGKVENRFRKYLGGKKRG